MWWQFLHWWNERCKIIRKSVATLKIIFYLPMCKRLRSLGSVCTHKQASCKGSGSLVLAMATIFNQNKINKGSKCYEQTRYVESGFLQDLPEDRKSTRLNSSHVAISYAVFCLK